MAVRAIVAILTAIPVACFVTGCRGATGEPGRTTITVWSGWTGDEEDAFGELVADFNRAHPDILLRNVSTNQDDTKTFRAIIAGTPPDLCFLWSGEYMGALAAMGALRPLDDLFEASGFREEQFLAQGLELCKYRGRLYMMPFLHDAYGLYWNRRIFAAAGLDPDRPPQDLDELLDYARLLTLEEDGQLVRLGLDPFELTTALAMFGGRLYDPDARRIDCTGRDAVRALEYYCAAVDAIGGPERVDSFASGFGEYASSQHQFFVGKVAMTISGNWWPVFIERYAPDMDYGLAPIPSPRDRPDIVKPTVLGGNFLCIPRDSPHPAEAWEVIRFFQTRESQVHFSNVMFGVPNIREYAFLPEITEGSRTKEAFAKICDIAYNGTQWVFPVTEVSVEYYREVETAAALARSKAKTPVEALADLEARMQRRLDKALLGVGWP